MPPEPKPAGDGDPAPEGDARSHAENRRYRDLAERRKASNPEYAYMPRWVPTGNWHMSWGDLLVILFGLGILLMVLVMRWLGIIGATAG